MNFVTKRIVWQPGAVTASTAFNLPSGYEAARFPHAEIHRYDHGHTAMTVLESAVAADVTAFVGIKDGTGTAVTGVTVGNAGGGTDAAVPTSVESALPLKVAATTTYVSATSLKLSVALEAADILVLDIVPVGEAPAYL